MQDVLKKGTGGYNRVVKALGDDVLQANGEVDRPKLGQIVFSDPAKRQLLNWYWKCACGCWMNNEFFMPIMFGFYGMRNKYMNK